MSAQKNTVLVGGNVEFNSTKTGDNKTNSFEFNPKVGYQFTDHFTAGVEAGILTSKTDSQQNIFGMNYSITDKTNAFSYGAFVRYAEPLSDVFAVYAELGVGGISKKNDTTVSNVVTTTKANGMYVKLTPALFINFKKSFGLNFAIGGLGYETTKWKDSDVKTNTFNFNFGKEVSVGISKNF